MSRLEPHGLADIAHGGSAAIGDDLRGHAGAVAAVFFVEILDDFFAPFVLEIDVDIRRLVAGGGDESLEEHVDASGIDAR